MIAICPKNWYAKQVLKNLDQALKEGYKPGGEKRHLRVSASKKKGSEEDSEDKGE